MGEPGTYTRRKGLDHETNKALILKHLAGQLDNGAPISEFQQVLPAQSRRTIQRMLNELRDEREILLTGRGAGARWKLRQKIAPKNAPKAQ